MVLKPEFTLEDWIGDDEEHEQVSPPVHVTAAPEVWSSPLSRCLRQPLHPNAPCQQTRCPYFQVPADQFELESISSAASLPNPRRPSAAFAAPPPTVEHGSNVNNPLNPSSRPATLPGIALPLESRRSAAGVAILDQGITPHLLLKLVSYGDKGSLIFWVTMPSWRSATDPNTMPSCPALPCSSYLPKPQTKYAPAHLASLAPSYDVPFLCCEVKPKPSWNLLPYHMSFLPFVSCYFCYPAQRGQNGGNLF